MGKVLKASNHKFLVLGDFFIEVKKSISEQSFRRRNSYIRRGARVAKWLLISKGYFN